VKNENPSILAPRRGAVLHGNQHQGWLAALAHPWLISPHRSAVRSLKGVRGYFAAILIFSVTSLCFAQTYTHRGFLENRGTFYPQKAANDRAQAVGESLFRYEGFYAPSPTFEVAGAVDFRTDTHHQVDRDFKLSWQDRGIRRPLGDVRRLSANYHNGPVTFEIGKQFIRWGKTDIVTPTDRFAPRDFLNVVDNEFLAVTAARLNFEKGANTIEAVWSPRFTPSRIPLANQRWAPESASGIGPVDVQLHVPGGPQAGLRWNHAGAVEYEVSLYQGFNHLPSFTLNLPLPDGVELFYPTMLMAGSDVAIPTGFFTIKGEAAYFKSNDKRVDEYALYVVQIERQSGEWFFIGGYAGETVTNARMSRLTSTFAPDRGLTKTILGRAGYTIDANRNVAVETAARQNGADFWLKAEYSQAFGQHWRATLNLTLIRGALGDFLGEYRSNSHALLILRYSF